MVVNDSLYRRKVKADGLWSEMTQVTWQDYGITKRPNRRLICILLGMAFIVLWYMSRQGEMPTSAVLCKSEILKEIWPSAAERKKKLAHFGHTDAYTLEKDFYAYVSHPSHMCYRQKHLGSTEDGGWEICLDGGFDVMEPCLVYSFGVGDDMSFEHAIEDFSGCEIHAFDPSLGEPAHKFAKRSYFHDIGLGMKDGFALGGRWKMRRLKTIMEELGHEDRTIDYLKIDIEFSEWLALHDMIESGILKKVRHLAMEIHTPELDVLKAPKSICTWNNAELLTYMMDTLIKLENMGFSMFYTRPNQRIEFISAMTGEKRLCCYNLHYVNTAHKANHKAHKKVF